MRQNQYIFTIYKDMCPSVTLNGLRIPQAEDIKYLGLYLDYRLEKTCIHQAKTIWISNGKSVLAVNHNCRVKTSCYYTGNSPII